MNSSHVAPPGRTGGWLRRTTLSFLFAAAGWVAPAVEPTGVTRTWTGAGGDADWFNAANWDSGQPETGDAVVVNAAKAAVLLTSTPPALDSFTISASTLANAATLTLSNWTTRLQADTVTVGAYGVVTCSGPFTNAPAMSNRVWIVCDDLSIARNGSVHADGRGYQGGYGLRGPGSGPGGGTNTYASAGYGGRGGGNNYGTAYYPWGGPEYGTAETPFEPGSGGCGNTSAKGGAGGGAIRIEAANRVVVCGTLSANGVSGDAFTGSGSGGAVSIACDTFTGTNGIVRAEGGHHGSYSQGRSAAGGGRIAIAFNPAAQAALPPPRDVTFSANRGATQPDQGWPMADLGTLWFPTDALIDLDGASLYGKLIFGNVTDCWSPSRLRLTNGWARLYPDSVRMEVAGDFCLSGPGGDLRVIENGTRWDVGGCCILLTNRWPVTLRVSGTVPSLKVGGDLVVSNRAILHVFSAAEAAAGSTNLGASVQVAGDLVVADRGCVYPHAHLFSGASPRFDVGGLRIPDASAGMNAGGLGFRGHFGGVVDTATPVYPSLRSGGGHGGRGGIGAGFINADGGQTFDAADEPEWPGSGGSGDYSSSYPSRGGGVIRVFASGDALINGFLRADGAKAGSYTGAGAGGAVLLRCRALSGTNGVMAADGGTAVSPDSPGLRGGGGGGGRIAVHFDTAAQAWTPGIRFSANGGYSQAECGNPGTLWFSDSRFLQPFVIHSGVWSAPDLGTSWSPPFLIVSNAWLSFTQPGFALAVTGDVTVVGTNEALCRLDLTNGAFSCGGDLRLERSRLTLYQADDPGAAPVAIGGACLLTNSAALYLYSGSAKAEEGEPGVVFQAEHLSIGTNCWVYPIAHSTNGAAPLFKIQTLLVQTNAGFNANAAGYRDTIGTGDGAFGPRTGPDGRGYWFSGIGAGGGGGYGGAGGRHSATRGLAYGSSNAPVQVGCPGSGSYQNNISGSGGGLIRIEAERWARLNGGSLLANGGAPGSFRSGGSGGGIYLRCRSFSGGGATLQAKGANGYRYTTGTSTVYCGGGGGGGRIAVWRRAGDAAAVCSVDGGVGGLAEGQPDYEAYCGEGGTVVWGWLPQTGTTLLLR